MKSQYVVNQERKNNRAVESRVPELGACKIGEQASVVQFSVFVFKVTSIAVCVSHGEPVSIDMGDCEPVISKELRNSEIERKLVSCHFRGYTSTSKASR